MIQIIITKLLRVKSKTPELSVNNKHLSMFLDFQRLVEKHCLTNKKVSFYARELAVSTKTLNNITNSILDKSAKVFIDDIVIIESKRRIINSDNSHTEIAYQMGYDDPTNFFKYFKKHTGMKPSQFRDSFRS